MTIVIGVDLATADVRVVAVDVDSGRVLAERRAGLPVGVGAEGERIQPARHGELSRELIAAVAADLGPRAREVRALSVTGTSGSVVPVDAGGTPVGNVVLYDDPRGAAQLRALTEAGFSSRPVGALARTAWMHDEAPAARYAFTPDVVVAALAGRLLPSDTSHALKSGIDPVAATWDDAALAVAGLPRERMPELVRPGTVVGEITPSSIPGLPDGVLIVAGMTDGSTGQIATGAVADGDTVGVLGTTLVLKAVSPHDVVDTPAGIYSHVAPDGLFWPGGASNTGAGVLRSGLTGGLDPATHSADIAASGPAPVVTYPLVRRGERFPLASADFEGFSVSLDGVDRPPADALERFRSVYEGVAFVERLGLERLTELGVDVRRHHLAGGAAASEVWNVIRASALNRAVVVTRGAGSAHGAAALAASAIQPEPLAGIARRFAGARTTVEPDASLVAELEERYLVFRAALAARTGA